MSLLTNLISYWKFDEASGDAADSQGSETLTNVGTATYAAGALNNAVNLVSGTPSYLKHASDASLETGNIDYTFAFWIKFDTLPGAGKDFEIITKSQRGGASASEYACFYDRDSSRFAYEHRDSGGSQVFTVVANNFGAASTGVWYFVVFWMDVAGDTAYIQVNNGTVDSANIAGTPSTANTIPLNIGWYNNAAVGGFTGGTANVDETGFWKRTLTAAERTGLYNAGTPLAFDQFAGFGATGGNPIFFSGGSLGLS